jgi:hypothetical protein
VRIEVRPSFSPGKLVAVRIRRLDKSVEDIKGLWEQAEVREEVEGGWRREEIEEVEEGMGG